MMMPICFIVPEIAYFCSFNCAILELFTIMLTTTFILGLSLSAWVTIAIVTAVFLLLMFSKLPEDVVFLGAIGMFMLTGVLSTDEALSGFSSTSVVLIGVLFVVVAGLTFTGVLQWIVRNLLGFPKTLNGAIVRLMFPVALLSSFLSDTMVVALLVDVVRIWAKKLHTTPSKLLIPLSYASLMGGVCTLLGTPPNLIISGMYAQETGTAMNIFVPTIPALACLCVGVLSMLAFKHLLPTRTAPEEAFSDTADYIVELLVPTNSKWVGSTAAEAGLHSVNGGSLIEIIRFDNEVISPVSPDEFILGGDHLVYSGQVDEILELKRTHDLANAQKHVFHISDVDGPRRFRLAHVSHSCPLVGHSIAETDFEEKHDMALVAVSREGESLKQSPRSVTFVSGDTLLFECPAHSAASKVDVRGLHFFENGNVLPNISGKTAVSTLIMLGMVLLSAFNVLPLLKCAVLAAFAMLVFRCCTPKQALESVNWNILMLFAGSIVIGSAIEKTGLATAFANSLLGVCGSNPYVVMAVLSGAATVVTALISDTATGAIFFPIVFHAATTLGCNPVPFLVSLMLAVSSPFSTPIGTPANMLVYAPGAYRFTDFIKIGVAMTAVYLAANLIVVPLVFPFH